MVPKMEPNLVPNLEPILAPLTKTYLGDQNWFQIWNQIWFHFWNRPPSKKKQKMHQNLPKIDFRFETKIGSQLTLSPCSHSQIRTYFLCFSPLPCCWLPWPFLPLISISSNNHVYFGISWAFLCFFWLSPGHLLGLTRLLLGLEKVSGPLWGLSRTSSGPLWALLILSWAFWASSGRSSAVLGFCWSSFCGFFGFPWSSLELSVLYCEFSSMLTWATEDYGSYLSYGAFYHSVLESLVVSIIGAPLGLNKIFWMMQARKQYPTIGKICCQHYLRNTNILSALFHGGGL